MRFSILVPVYNVEKYLRQCIESVLVQEFEDYELILVNDGSTDHSPEICKEYSNRDKRIKYYSKENEGLLLTRRYSINKASGEYILFLDSDDYWESHTLISVEKAIQESNADMIIYRFRRIRDDGTLIYEDKDIFPDKTLFTDSNKENFIKKFVSSSRLNVMWAKCVKREIVDNKADYSSFRDKKGEDLLQSIALIRNASSIYYTNDVLYNYRLSHNGRGRNFKIKYITDYEAVRNHVLNNLKSMNISDATICAFYMRYIEGLMSYMNSIAKASNSYTDFAEHCNMIKKFELFNEASKSVNASDLICKASINYKLFTKGRYRLLFEKCWLYNAVKGLLKS